MINAECLSARKKLSDFTKLYIAPLSFGTGRQVEWDVRCAKLEEVPPLEVEKLPPVALELLVAEVTLLPSVPVPGHAQLSVCRSRLYRGVH